MKLLINYLSDNLRSYYLFIKSNISIKRKLLKKNHLIKRFLN